MNITKAFVITLLSQAVIIISGILNNMIIARTLGPEGQGVYALVLTTSVMLFVFGGGGIATSNIYWVKKDKSEASAIFINSIIFAILVSVIFFAAYILFAKDIMAKFFTPDISIILMISVPMIFIQEFNQGMLWGLERYDYHNFLSIFKASSLVVANIILVAILKFSLKFAVLGWFLAVSLTSIFSTFILWKEIGSVVLFPRILLLLRSLRMGIKVLAGDVMWFAATRIDIYIVAYFLGAKEVGYYSIAILIMQMVNLIPAILGKFIFNNSIINNDRENILALHLIKITILYAAIAVLAILLSGKLLIWLLFGPAFEKTFECLLLLLPAAMAQSMNTSLGYFIGGKKAIPLYNIFAIIITMLISVVLNIFLVPRFGINGAAVASSVSQVVQLILFLRFLKKNNIKLSWGHILRFRLNESLVVLSAPIGDKSV